MGKPEHVLKVFILLLLLPGCLLAEEKPAVLVVHSYHVGMPWVDGVTKGLRDSLQDTAELVITQLDIKRFPAAGREQAMAMAVSSKAAAARARLVISIDDYAWRFCHERHSTLFPGVPIVFGGVNFWNQQQPPNTTGVVEDIDLENTLRLLQRLQPELRRLVVVNDRTETGQANQAKLDNALLGAGLRSEILNLGDGSYEETEKVLTRLSPAKDAVLLLSWNLDKTGRTRSYEEAITRARRLCPAPLYGPWDFYFGHGLLGGSLLDSHIHGMEIGDLAKRILNGERADRIPVVTRCRSRLVVDDRELRRFMLPAERVPAEAETAHVEVSRFSQYKIEIALALLVIAAQGVTITILLLGRRRRLRVESELRKNETRLRITLSSLGEAVFSTDEKGAILAMNPAAQLLVGRPYEEIVGRPHGEIFRFQEYEHGPSVPSPVEESLEAGVHRATTRPLWFVVPGRKSRQLMISAAPLRHDSPQRAGVVAVMHDVTDTVRLEDQLRQSQKMESIGLLAGGVAHDFNNLLQVIQGSLQLIEDAECTEDERKESMQQIGDAVKRAAELTRQLLAFGRKQTLDIQSHDLSLLVENLLKMLRRLIGENIELQFRPEPGRFFVLADKHQLEQVMLNLCINARDAMAGGGRLGIALDEIVFSEEDAARQAGIKAGGFIQVSITDTGCGMNRETVARIFDPFFTTKPAGKGTGLGLAVVQGIILQHQGFINVYSEPGKGTTFRFYLPAGEATTNAPATPSSPATKPAPTGTRGTLLYAEDDRTLRDMTTRILERYGYQVIACTDGEEACRVIQTQACHLDAALLDVVMPGMGGIEAARRIRNLRPELPIILSSGYAEHTLGAVPIPEGCLHLAKPYPAEALLSLLEKRPIRSV